MAMSTRSYTDNYFYDSLHYSIWFPFPSDAHVLSVTLDYNNKSHCTLYIWINKTSSQLVRSGMFHGSRTRVTRDVQVTSPYSESWNFEFNSIAEEQRKHKNAMQLRHLLPTDELSLCHPLYSHITPTRYELICVNSEIFMCADMKLLPLILSTQNWLNKNAANEEIITGPTGWQLFLNHSRQRWIVSNYLILRKPQKITFSAIGFTLSSINSIRSW